jgi:gamma-butyrobetaine dioxygenase
MIVKAAEIEVAALKCTASELEITWQNSSYSVYSSLWLRDNDPANRDSRTGQRLASLLDLPLSPQLQAAEPRPPGHITLSWDDGETSVFSLTWLRAFDRSLRMTARPTQLPWMGQSADAFAWCDYTEWVQNPASREDWLYSVGRDGLAFLRSLPNEEGTGESALLRVAALISLAAETNYGRTFDLRTVVEQNHHGYTSSGRPVHTSHPYRDPVPGFQLLHCLSAPGQGGDSIFVDGMAVAERVRAHDPDAFAILSQTPVPYRFQDASVELVAERTMLDIDTQGQFRAIYYDDRSLAPLPFKGPRLNKYYPAYRQLAQLLREPARLVTYEWKPGDLVLFDNTRILHSHTAVSIGSRHLQGCYLDADGLYSALAVLSRNRSARGDEITA